MDTPGGLDEVEAKKESKRQNTSKTPVRSTATTKTQQQMKTPPRGYKYPTQQKMEKFPSSCLKPPKDTNVEEETFTSVPPSYSIVDPKSKRKATPKPSEPETQVATNGEAPDQTTLEDIDHPKSKAWTSRKLEFLLLLPILLLSLITGGWLLDRLSTKLELADLRMELKNCKLMNAGLKPQDEYYIKELEEQVTSLKRTARSIEAELKVLQEECNVGQEAE